MSEVRIDHTGLPYDPQVIIDRQKQHIIEQRKELAELRSQIEDINDTLVSLTCRLEELENAREL